MKLIIDENIVVFLDKLYLNNIDLKDYSQIEKKLIKIVNKIQNKCLIDINGYYNVYIYTDESYGIIIDMQKENLEYIDYFNNQLEFNIEVFEDSFLYKIDDILRLEKTLLNKFIIYKNKENLYLKAKEKISNIELGIILENSEIIYGEIANNIKQKSQIIK